MDDKQDMPPPQYSPGVVQQQPGYAGGAVAHPQPYVGQIGHQLTGPVTQQPRFDNPYNAGYMQLSGPQSPQTTNTNVTVVMGGQPTEPGYRRWASDTCSCFEDCESCLCTYFCPPCYLCCHISPRMGESCCDGVLMPLAGHSPLLVYRTKMRARHNIVGSALDDCCMVTCCPLCVQCQLKRELDFIERITGKVAFDRN